MSTQPYSLPHRRRGCVSSPPLSALSQCFPGSRYPVLDFRTTPRHFPNSTSLHTHASKLRAGFPTSPKSAFFLFLLLLPFLSVALLHLKKKISCIWFFFFLFLPIQPGFCSPLGFCLDRAPLPAFFFRSSIAARDSILSVDFPSAELLLPARPQKTHRCLQFAAFNRPLLALRDPLPHVRCKATQRKFSPWNLLRSRARHSSQAFSKKKNTTLFF